MYAIITISLPRINDELIKDEIKAFENYCEDRGYNPTDRISETCSTKVGRYHIRMEKYIPADDIAKKLIEAIIKGDK